MSSPSPIAVPGFVRLMVSRFVSNMAKQVRMLVLMWQMWELTHEPIMLGFIGLAEGIPFIGASLFTGHLVDRREKKTLLVLGLAGIALSSAGLAVISRMALPSPAAIYGLIGFSALCSSLELPAASSYLQLMVPSAGFSRAAAWNLTQYVVATVLGPIAGGFLLERWGASFVHWLSAGGVVLSIVLALPLKAMPPLPVERVQSTLAAVADGLKFVYRTRIIFASMVIDSFAVLFGEVVFILPVFADRMGVGPIGLGFLRAAPAIGSCVVALSESFRPIVRIRWDWLRRAAVAFGLSLMIFAISKNFFLSFAMLFMSGAADGVSVIIRQSLYQLHTPDAYRGRVSSVSGIFISISNEIGGFESGLAAQLMGAVPSVIFGGVITLLTAAVMRWKYPRLDDEVAHAK